MISKIINTIRDIRNKLEIIIDENDKIANELKEAKILTAQSLINETNKKGIVNNIHETEFKVFSQFGDDGIIQYLINNIEIKNKTFIEFGVENYSEANTRFLLINNNWRGLVMDGDPKNIESIQKEGLYWRNNLIAKSVFITKENINNLITESGFNDEIGLLSIDIDGNDYWVWEAITVVNPVIVIVEYNSIFGSKLPVSIPYDENFIRSRAHYSYLLWGASLAALNYLAEKKGYKFIGNNSAGCNAYFIREDKIGNLKPISVTQGYIESNIRDSRDKNGNLSYLSGKNRLKEIENCAVVDVVTSNKIIIKDLFHNF